ncbi:MAG: hypothetical protein EXX96DRAFT_595657 [Benjaminiella poitrasii]|nr:MAG: hypothetical protein EXX96DRAFT_595657 [Benjaminiella poitrasii]
MKVNSNKYKKNDIQSASVVAKKRLIDNEPVEIEVGLDDVLTKGVYRALFNLNEFQELDEEMCTLLNTDWSTKKHIKYSCSALLAGMIMVINSKAILVLCHEVYGRTRSVDVHREDFTSDCDNIHNNNHHLPHSLHLDPPYRNIWVTTITDNHGSKLIFGTKTFNSLVTSSIRIDSPYEPEVGPYTHHFTISSNEQSRDIKIYIHKESWNKAKKLIIEPHNHTINTYDFLYQTRQIQTNFHYRSAYNRSRAASMITDNHTLYPYNIFTLSQCNNGPDISDYKTMSEVFREIALKIFVEEDSDIEEDEIVGSLKKKFIEDQIQKCKSEGEIIKILQSILNLYGNDVEIPVIKNSQLNNLLELSVNQLLPVITRVNEHIISSLKQAFSSYV